MYFFDQFDKENLSKKCVICDKQINKKRLKGKSAKVNFTCSKNCLSVFFQKRKETGLS